MPIETQRYREYLDALQALQNESQMIREEISRTMAFEHLHQRIKSIKQQIELIHGTLEPRTFAEKAHVEHLHHTALSLISHHIDVDDNYLKSLKENEEFWWRVEELQASILEQIEQLQTATEFESELTQSLSELNEQTENLLESVEQHHTAHPHMDTHRHIQHLKHQLHLLHHPHLHDEHDATHTFLEHYHDSIEEITSNMRHIQHRMNEIWIELTEENEKIKALKELEEEIEVMRLTYEEQQEVLKKSLEHQHTKK